MNRPAVISEGSAPLPDMPPDAAGEGRRRTPLRFKMFEDIEEAPRKLCLVEGLFGEGEISAIAGAPGSGKSVLAGDLACNVAAGMDWMSRRVRRPVGVLYIAAERAKLTERRFAAWRVRHGIDRLPLAVVSGGVDFLHNRDHVDEVAAMARRLSKATQLPVGLIIVDTVSRTLAGGDENGPKDMGAFVANIAALGDATGAHVLLIHHIPQGGDTRLRGHGALLGAVDTLVTVEKAGGSRVATVTKDNDGAENASFAFTLYSVELHIDEEGFVTTAPVVVPAGEPSGGPKPSANRKRLPPAAALALRAFEKTLVEVGETAPASNHIPPSVKVVTLDQWKRYAVQMNISDGEPRAQRLAFSRALDRLSADGIIATWEHFAWRT